MRFLLLLGLLTALPAAEPIVTFTHSSVRVDGTGYAWIVRLQNGTICRDTVPTNLKLPQTVAVPPHCDAVAIATTTGVQTVRTKPAPPPETDLLLRLIRQLERRLAAIEAFFPDEVTP
jgi:hypothetical protein